MRDPPGRRAFYVEFLNCLLQHVLLSGTLDSLMDTTALPRER